MDDFVRFSQLSVVASEETGAKVVIADDFGLIDFGDGQDLLFRVPKVRDEITTLDYCLTLSSNETFSADIKDFILQELDKAGLTKRLDKILTKMPKRSAGKVTINKYTDVIAKLIHELRLKYGYEYFEGEVRNMAIKSQNAQLAFLHLRYGDDSDDKMRQIIIKSCNAEWAKHYKYHINSEDTEVNELIS